MPDTYEIQSPYGVLEMQADHAPSAKEAAAVVRAYADKVAAGAQAKSAEAGTVLAAPNAENVGRFAAGAWDVLNPVSAAKGVFNALPIPQALGGSGIVEGPSGAVKAISGQMVDQGRQAIDLARQGRYVEAAGHGAAALLPVVGPAAAHAGEQIAAGDEAGGLGRGFGLVAPGMAGMALKGRAMSRAAGAEAPMLERAAQEQVAGRVLAPGNPAFRGRASAIAPEVLARQLSGGRPELQQAAAEGMADAGAKLDEAIQAAGGTKAQVPVGDIVARLQSKAAQLRDSAGNPLSEDAAGRIAALQSRIDQIKQLAKGSGIVNKGTVTFDDLKAIRDENYRLAEEARAYQRQGNPVKDTEGWAGREAGGAIREAFATRSPASAAASADYSFWKSLNDVLDPVLGRPKVTAPPVGVTGGARVTGAMVGNLMGPKAALVMSTVIPWLKENMASPSFQLASAQTKMALAKAIREGNVGVVKSTLLRLEQAAPTEEKAQP